MQWIDKDRGGNTSAAREVNNNEGGVGNIVLSRVSNGRVDKNLTLISMVSPALMIPEAGVGVNDGCVEVMENGRLKEAGLVKLMRRKSAELVKVLWKLID